MSYAEIEKYGESWKGGIYKSLLVAHVLPNPQQGSGWNTLSQRLKEVAAGFSLRKRN